MPNQYFTPCFHPQQGMAHPHNQEICNHVPDEESVSQMPYFVHMGYDGFYPVQPTWDGVYDEPQTFAYTEFDNASSHFVSPEPVLSEKPTKRYENIAEPIKRIYDEISAECEHFLKKKDCTECRSKVSVSRSSTESPIAANENLLTFKMNDDITQLAMSMKKKREQNKLAAARYREKKKCRFYTALEELDKLEARNTELKTQIVELESSIAERRKLLGLSKN